jgi:hypothetical protein
MTAVGALCFLLGNMWDYPMKYFVKNYYLSEYAGYVENCDNAMREHFLAKSTIVSEPSYNSMLQGESAELALVDCHEYDKFRKYLLSLGLEENDLSIMGLHAIERKKTDLIQLVKEHEIRY